jgi:hypothetical protein
MSRLGELHSGAVAHDQRRARFRLQLGHLLGYGGRREGQGVGSAGVRAAPHHFHERLEPGEIHLGPSAATSTAVVRTP